MAVKKRLDSLENQEKNLKMKKRLLIIFGPILLILIIVLLFVNNNLSKLKGDSVTNYYCEDVSYKLEGDKCVKEIKKQAYSIGDVDMDSSITEADADLIHKYVDDIVENDAQLSDYQIKLADVNKDGEVYYIDEQILRSKLSENLGTYGIYASEIDEEKVCEEGFKLKNDTCVKDDIIPAKKDNGSVLESDDYSDPVEVTFKPQDNETLLKVNTTYKINVDFDIKDTSKQYYYIWTNYLYGEQNYSTECKPVTQGEQGGNFKVTGTRTINVKVYSDSGCTNEVSSVYSDSYECDGCQNMVNVAFKPQDNKTSLPYNTKYKLNAIFDVRDTSKDYYYIWNAYLNGTKNYETDCTKITSGEYGGSITINGKRIVSLVVYSDSSCKNKVKTFNSKEYVCTDCDNSVNVTFKPQDNKTSLPYNTKYKLNVKFDINDKSKNYYYIWSAYLNGTKNTETNCTKITPGERGGSITIDGKRIVSLTVYGDSKCKNKIKTVNSKEYICIDCKKSVDVTFKPQDNKVLAKKNTYYQLKVKFDVNDTSKKYYYKWRNYKNGEISSVNDCKSIQSGEYNGNFYADGYRKIKVTVYNDSKCKNEIKSENSKLYMYDGIISGKQIKISKKKELKINQGGGLQGVCLTDKYIIALRLSRANLKGEQLSDLYIIDKNTFEVKKLIQMNLFGHANDCTYNPNTKEITVVTSEGNKSPAIKRFKINDKLLMTNINEYYRDAKTKNLYINGKIKNGSTFDGLPGITSIAYDKDHNQYIIYSGSFIYITNDNYRVVKSFPAYSYLKPQGIAYRNNKIYLTLFESGDNEKNTRRATPSEAGSNVVYIYDMDGNFENALYIPKSNVSLSNKDSLPEIESMDFDSDGTIFMGFTIYQNGPKAIQFYTSKSY